MLLAERRRGTLQYVEPVQPERPHEKPQRLTLPAVIPTSENSTVETPTTPTPPILPEPMKSTNWLVIALLAAVLAAIFLAFAKPGSKLDFLGWFKVEQGPETPSHKPSAEKVATSTITVIGTIKINNRNARPDQVNSVYVKGETAGARASVDMNGFRLREVRIPKDRLITIAIDLPSDQSASQLFRIPELDPDGVANLGEVLLTVDYSKPSRKPSKGKATGSPTIIINNQNIQKN